MARLNQTCVVPVQYLESIVQLRLSQAHRSRCASSDQYNRPFAIRVNSSLRFPHRAFLAVLPNGGRFVPGAILVAVAVGRFANNRSPPTSQWAKLGNHSARSTRPTTLAGTEVASDPRQRQRIA